MATTSIVREKLAVIYNSGNFGTASEPDRDLLDNVLKVSAKIAEPTTVKFSDLREHLTDNSGAPEILLALKFTGKRATPAKTAAPGA